jgi:hypothetical protein
VSHFHLADAVVVEAVAAAEEGFGVMQHAHVDLSSVFWTRHVWQVHLADAACDGGLEDGRAVMQQAHDDLSSVFCTKHVWHVHFWPPDDDEVVDDDVEPNRDESGCELVVAVDVVVDNGDVTVVVVGGFSVSAFFFFKINK